MADGGGDNGSNGAASTETGTTVVGSPQPAMIPKKPKKRKKKKSESSAEQSSGGGANVSGCTAPDGDGAKEKQEANKKDRLVWGPKLHGKFVRACKELGVKDAVPMKILRRMKISGVTRAQVASHLQKYRGNLSKHKDEETNGNRSGDATTAMVMHHTTPLDAASPSPPATATAIPPSVPPSPQSPLETSPDTMPNGHRSGDHAVAAANYLLHQQQQLQLLLLPPVQHQHYCFPPPPPPLLHQVGAVTITAGEEPPCLMQQQAAVAVAAASQHGGPTLVGVEQAAGAPVPPANDPPAEVQPSQAVDMLRAFPTADMRLEEPPETRMAQALAVDAQCEKGQQRAAEEGSIIERYWGSGDRPSWDLLGLRPISTDAVVVPTAGDFHAKD